LALGAWAVFAVSVGVSSVRRRCAGWGDYPSPRNEILSQRRRSCLSWACRRDLVLAARPTPEVDFPQ